jgi:hypothetical protein
MDFDPYRFTEGLISKAGGLTQNDKDALLTLIGILLFVGACLWWYIYM